MKNSINEMDIRFEDYRGFGGELFTDQFLTNIKATTEMISDFFNIKSRPLAESNSHRIFLTINR